MTDNGKHALLSPSSAEKWMLCPGSVLMEKDLVDEDSEYAAEGTCAHELAALCLTTNLLAEAKVGTKGSNGVVITEGMAEYVQEYVRNIREFSKSHDLLIEQALPIGHITGEEGAEGTGDAIILSKNGEVLEINDFKYGMGVKVYAKNNKQMMLYALGALHRFRVLGDFNKFILRIHQVRLNHLDEWECSLAELTEFAEEVEFRAKFIHALIKGEVTFKPKEDLVPKEEACRWCKAKATCPALAAHTLETVAEDYVDLTKNPVAKLHPARVKLQHATNEQLSWFMQNLGLIEDWIKAVRAKTEGELLAGHEIPGFKLVPGKKGNRKWEDEKAVEKKMRDLKIKETDMYKRKLISPSDAEKLLKKDKDSWAALIPLYNQPDGAPSVAPSTDPRPALELGAREDDFDVIEDGTK